MITYNSTFQKSWWKKIYYLLVVLAPLLALSPSQARQPQPGEYVLPDSITYVEATPLIVSSDNVTLNLKVAQLFKKEITLQNVEVFLITLGEENLSKMAEVSVLEKFNIREFKKTNKTYVDEFTTNRTVNLNLDPGQYQLKTGTSEARVDFEVVPAHEPTSFSMRLTGKVIPNKIPADEFTPERDASYVSNEIRVHFEESLSYSQKRDLLSKILEQVNGKIIGREYFDYQIQIPDTADGSGVKTAIELIKSSNLATWAAPRYVPAQYKNFCTLLTLSRKFSNQPGFRELFPASIGIAAISFLITVVLLILLGRKIRKLIREKHLRLARLLLILYIGIACLISLVVPHSILALARSWHCY